MKMKIKWTKSNISALSILCVMIIAPILLVCIPWLSAYRNMSQEIDTNRESLQRYRDTAARLPELRKQLAVAQQNHATVGYWPTGSKLLDTVKAMAEQHGVTLADIQEKPDIEHKNNILQQSLQLSLMARSDHLTALLHDIETHKPALFINDISIGNPQAFANAPNGAQGAPGSLQVSVEISGYTIKPKDKSNNNQQNNYPQYNNFNPQYNNSNPQYNNFSQQNNFPQDNNLQDSEM